jgi:hypothetical protein
MNTNKQNIKSSPRLTWKAFVDSNNKAAFLLYKNGQIKIINQIEELSRVILPPYSKEYPYESYEFTNMEDVFLYIERAKQESIASLYDKAKSVVKKYNEQDEYTQILLASNIVWSYFQDRFSTIHYLGVIGDNGSGTVGDTFEALGYRAVNLTDPNKCYKLISSSTVEPGLLLELIYGLCTTIG